MSIQGTGICGMALVLLPELLVGKPGNSLGKLYPVMLADGAGRSGLVAAGGRSDILSKEHLWWGPGPIPYW